MARSYSSMKFNDMTWTIETDTPIRRLVRAIRELSDGQVLTVQAKGNLGGLQRQLYGHVGHLRGRRLRTHINGKGLEVQVVSKQK